jgi:hypothetical protein
MEILDNLPPSIGLVLGLLLIVWLVLALLVPFMIESIRSSNRRSLAELEEINDKLERVVALLERRAAPTVASTEAAVPVAAPVPHIEDDEDELEAEEQLVSATHFERRRREPTL